MSKQQTWSFDIGTSSLGYAVRGAKGNEFEFNDVESLLIPDEFASTKPATQRRRAYRTREAHKKREEWLRKVFEEAGLESLHGRKAPDERGKEAVPGDKRLEKEFPAKGENTIYCGALLRIALLQGKKLEEWQVFKAFHSAIQKRGYDPDVPWKRDSDTEKDSETKERATSMGKEIINLSGDKKSQYHYPCYWEAYRMGLWSPQTPNTWEIRINHKAKSTKYGKSKDPIGMKREQKDAERKVRESDFRKIVPLVAVYPRSMVAKELRDMFKEAEKQYPSLKGKSNYLLYGPANKAYASYHAEKGGKDLYDKVGGRKNLRRGKETDWQGSLAQKIPTFDNRSPNKCTLIPRFNVCRALPKINKGVFDKDSFLPAEVTFLMKLKNLRFDDGSGKHIGFESREIEEIFGSCLEKAKKQDTPEEAVKQLKLTRPQLKKWLNQSSVIVGHEEVKPPKVSGRSRFSRPALKIIKDLILSGKNPKEFGANPKVQRLFVGNNTNRKKGLIKKDLEFLNDMKDTWEGLYIPNETLSEYNSTAESNDSQIREKQIYKIIATRKDPIVRHRLGVFYDRIRKLEKVHGVPEKIVIEFVREDWMRGDSKEAKSKKKKYKKDIERREQENSEARECLKKHSRAPTKKNILKWKLWKEQGTECIFCFKKVSLSQSGCADQEENFDMTHLAHIVPNNRGGPKIYLNLVLACNDCNEYQKIQYHYDWLSSQRHWKAFVEGAKKMNTHGMKPGKIKLLATSDIDEAGKMIDNRMKLQQTAEISKLSQTITCLHFGWPLNFEGQERKVAVVNGALTDRVARRYELHKLLRGQENEEVPKKAREDKRHHALDAMILSFIPNWARDNNKEINYALPKKILDQGPIKFFKKYLEKVVPYNIYFDKPVLRESIYGRRRDENGKEVATIRRPLKELGNNNLNQWGGKKKLEPRIKRIMDKDIMNKISSWVDKRSNINATEWEEFCRDFRLNEKGPIIRKVRCSNEEAIYNEKTGILNYDDLGKEKGQYRTEKECGHGYFLYLDSKGKVKVRPVRVFESKYKISKQLRENKEEISKVFGFFRSGFGVDLKEEIITKRDKIIIPAGEYFLNTIRSAGQIKLTSSDGQGKIFALSYLLNSSNNLILQRICKK